MPDTAEERKAINDAVAYIRSLAELRGRNADWAERAVRDAASLSARAALTPDVIDVIAADRARPAARSSTAARHDRDRRAHARDRWRVARARRARLAHAAARCHHEPDVAYLLLLIGIYGLIFEGYNPGAVLPGVVGAICLLLALYAFQLLPVNYAGLALIVLGVVLMVRGAVRAELRLARHRRHRRVRDRLDHPARYGRAGLRRCRWRC